MAGSETGEVIYELEQKFSVTLHNMPERYGIGYAVVRKGELVGFADVRVAADLLSFYLPLEKTFSANKLQGIASKPVALFCQWPDEIRWVNLCQPFDYIVGGQKKNDAFMEVEPCAVIPREMFMSLKDLEV